MAGSPLPHDLRLATAVSVAWLSAAIGVAGTGRRALLMAVAAGAVGLVALAASRRGRQLASVLAMSAFCAALLLAPLAARLANAGNSPLAALARQRVELTAELTVTADPRSLAATGVAGSPRAAVDAEVTGVTVAGQRERARGAVLVLGPAALWRDVLPGQRVRLDVRAQPPLPGNLLVATFAAQSDPVLLGSPPWWQRAAGRVRGSMRQAASGLPGDASGLLPGLVDGDTAGLDPVLAEHFQLAGLTHLVAVSGANCAILLGAVLLVLRRLRCGPRTCALVGVLVLVAFVVVARPSPSVLRAAAMAALALYGLATGRERGTLPALSAAVLGLLLWQPELAASAGFAMSVLATGALLMVAPGWADALARRRVPSWLAGPLAVAAAAHLVTAPVVAAISGKVSLVAVPANLLAEPVMGAVTVLGFCAAATAPFSEGAGTVFAWLAGWPCRWLIGVANFFGGMHGATLPWPAGVAGGLALLVVTAALWWFALRAGPRRVLAVLVIVGVLVQIPVRALVSGWPPDGWIMIACDVGQGDALVLPVAAHQAVVIDAGPDAVSVDRCLADLSVTDVPLLVLSHYHLDHVGGIAGVFHGRRVGAVITGPLPEPAAGLDLVHHVLVQHRMQVGAAPIGSSLTLGEVRLDFLAPLAPFRGTRSDPNNSSVIIRATVRGKRIMLAGDAEVEAQKSMLASGIDLRADVLKIPHHGSAYSEPGFLAAVHAQIGVISVGAGNDYGLPSPLLLAELARLGLPVRRTDQDGDVAITVVDGKLSVAVRGTRASTVGAAPSRARIRAPPG